MATNGEIEIAGAPTGEYDVGAAFGEHAIEWWVYDGARLVPASAEQADMLSRLHATPTRRGRGRFRRWRALAARGGARERRILSKS
jgi:hypothetical protein